MKWLPASIMMQTHTVSNQPLFILFYFMYICLYTYVYHVCFFGGKKEKDCWEGIYIDKGDFWFFYNDYMLCQ